MHREYLIPPEATGISTAPAARDSYLSDGTVTNGRESLRE